MVTYYYRVDIFCTTFQKDADKTKPFSHSEIFQGADLLECRNNAFQYYDEKIRGIANAQYVFPFESPQNFEFGKHSAISIELYLVEGDNLYSLSDPCEVEESLELEEYIFSQLGIENF